MSVDQVTLASQMTAQITAVNAVISTIGVLAIDNPVILSTVYAAVQNARVPFDTAIAAFDADIDTTTVGGVVSGQPGPVIAQALLTQASDVAQQSLVIIAEAFLLRVGINCQNYPG